MNNWFINNGNSILPNSLDLQAAGAYDYTNPDFRPTGTSPLLSGASFTSPLLTDPFFTPTTYRGAFGSEDWTDCWAEFDPQNADYTAAINHGPVAGFTHTLTLNQVTITNTSVNANSYFWNFGDPATTGDTSIMANPTYTYPGAGQYIITLITVNDCGTDTITDTLTISVGLPFEKEQVQVSLFPNPTQEMAYVEITLKEKANVVVTVSDLTGKKLFVDNQKELSSGNHIIPVNLNEFASGMYFVTIKTGEITNTLSLIKE